MKISILQLADIIGNLEVGQKIYFSENADGSETWGTCHESRFDGSYHIFSRLGSSHFEIYNSGAEEKFDLIKKLIYHLGMEDENSIVYRQFPNFPEENELSFRENIVSSFFFYMWNAWCKEECEKVFGWEYKHFWEKWCGICKIYNVYSATEKFYADLTTNNRAKLVNHACEIYNGRERRKEP